MNKKKHFSQNSVIKRYDSRRFGGKSGYYVNKKELAFFINNISKFNLGKALDAPCGTGRLMQMLPKINWFGIDTSPGMIKLCQQKCPKANLRLANMNSLPFPNFYFSIVINLRIFHHYPINKVEKMLRESVRVLQKGGVLMFDTHNRSPKSILSIFWPKSNYKIYLHKDKKIYHIAERLSLHIIETQKSFLFSPLLYRFLPLKVIKSLDIIEQIIPKSLLVRTFWLMQK